jgi:hypothetical protein
LEKDLGVLGRDVELLAAGLAGNGVVYTEHVVAQLAERRGRVSRSVRVSFWLLKKSRSSNAIAK